MLSFLRYISAFALLAFAFGAHAAPSPFDLVGPRLDVAVTRGGSTLPLERVPNLAEGDRISIKLDLPPGQGDRFRLVAAFLRGAVDRPPRNWFHDAVSGKDKGSDLSLVVPRGAQQLALFILPERGGSADAIISAVRKQPGTFVRAVQDLNRASLDRARLDTFLDALVQVERENPERVSADSQVLTRSLSIRLKAECLQQPVEVQAACLSGGRETLLFADTHSSALADTLTGAPTDLAFQLSATPQGGYGSYSSYIGVVRDILRLFGAFQSTQLQFVPALSRLRDGRTTLLLNTPLSFGKPASVMAIGLPAIEAVQPPPLRRAEAAGLLCAARGTVLPVEGAPLVYATRYAHDVVLRTTRRDGTTVDLPAHADPRHGGYVLDGPLPDGAFGDRIDGRLQGNWGFSGFDGPSFTLANPRVNAWAAPADATLVTGRTNTLALVGSGAGCISSIVMQRGDGSPLPLEWKPDGPGGIAIDVPLEKASAGSVTVTITGAPGTDPVHLSLRAMDEIGRIDSLRVRAGERDAILTGSRLDQVRSVTVGATVFRPDELSRADGADRLALVSAGPAVDVSGAGRKMVADIAFAGDRHRAIGVTIAPAPVTPTILQRSVHAAPAGAGTVPIALTPDDVFAQDARITFAFRYEGAAPLTGGETVEVATGDGSAAVKIAGGQGYDVQDGATGIVTIVPGNALGTVAHGTIQFRVAAGNATSRWVPIGTVTRLPAIRSIDCGGVTCTITGDRLYLIGAIASNERFADARPVTDGYTARTIDVPAPPAADRRLFLRLRDAPDATAVITVPTRPAG